MPERKGEGDKPPEFHRIDATAELTLKLDDEMQERYLFLERGSRYLDKARIGEIPFFSFEVSQKDPAFLREVLMIALTRAANPKDIAYSVHGSQRHETFNEAVQTLIESINKRSFKIEKKV